MVRVDTMYAYAGHDRLHHGSAYKASTDWMTAIHGPAILLLVGTYMH